MKMLCKKIPRSREVIWRALLQEICSTLLEMPQEMTCEKISLLNQLGAEASAFGNGFKQFPFQNSWHF